MLTSYDQSHELTLPVEPEAGDFGGLGQPTGGDRLLAATRTSRAAVARARVAESRANAAWPEGPRLPVRAVAVSPDGEEIVTGGDDGTARMWNRRSGEDRVVLRGHDGPVRAVAVRPDSRR